MTLPVSDAQVPVVGPREPCPCGSGRRYKGCHGRGSGADELVVRPFAGLDGEADWVALRELVPAATAPLHLVGSNREVVLSTVLPMAWPALVRATGQVLLGLQVNARSGDASRDLAAALEAALTAEPGQGVTVGGLPGPGARLQDLLAPGPLEVTVHDGFDYWVAGAPDPTGEVAASMERANSAVTPTARLSGVQAAYWTRMPERCHLRWVLPHEEEALLDGLARLAVVGTEGVGGLGLGAGTRYAGSFRAHGLSVPVWDLPVDTEPAAMEEPAAGFAARLDEALADGTPLTDAQRRARDGLRGRQFTLR